MESPEIEQIHTNSIIHAEFECAERTQLMNRLGEVHTHDASRELWACLWLLDIEVLRSYVGLSLLPQFTAMIFCLDLLLMSGGLMKQCESSSIRGTHEIRCGYREA